MITWQRTAEPFCCYSHRRRAYRRRLLVEAYRNATDPADRLAEPWCEVLATTLAEAEAGDPEALAWLHVCAPDRVK